jgi:hypothetical protein
MAKRERGRELKLSAPCWNAKTSVPGGGGERGGGPKKEENDCRIGLERILSRLGEGNLKANRVGSGRLYTVSEAPLYELSPPFWHSVPYFICVLWVSKVQWENV